MNKLLFIICFVFCLQNSSIGFCETTTIDTNFVEKSYQSETIFREDVKFKPKFKEKYKSDEFDYEQKKESESLWDKFINWLIRLLSSDSNSTSKSNFSFSFLTLIFKIVLFAALGYVLFLLIKTIINKKDNWFFSKSEDQIIEANEIVDIRKIDINFESEINKNIQNSNYKTAVRYYFLWVLKRLSDTNQIDWNVDKTNSDYLREIKNETLKSKFSNLSYIYNYCWYGDFEIDSAFFETAKNKFEETLKLLKN